MDLKTFFEHFDTLAEAPNGIQRLRELILDMALRGKLVPQDPDDEPAEELLQRVIKNKKNLLERGQLHQKNPQKKITKDEAPHDLPQGWVWCRFGQIIDCYRGHNPPKSEFIKKPREGYTRFVQITDFKTDKSAVYVPKSNKLKYVKKGEIAMAAYRHIGKLSRDVEGAFNVAICKVIEIEPISRDFIEKLIGSAYVKGALLAASGRAHIPSMHTKHLLSLVVPLPPLAEQKRIVAKVDELMVLCDTLEAAQQTRNALRQSLRASALDALMNATSDDELATAWAFVRDNWGTMSDRAEDVEGLRKVVLEAAVRGRLSKRQEGDEPVHRLLQVISKQREQLIKDGKLRKSSRRAKKSTAK